MNRRIEGIAQCVILAAFFAIGTLAVVLSVATNAWWLLVIGACSLIAAKVYYEEIARQVRNKRLQEKRRNYLED